MTEEKKGFKKTEVGLIPEDWTINFIPEITSHKSGIKIGPFGSQLKKDYLVSSGYKVYGQENVFRQNPEKGSRYVNSDRFRKLKSCELVPGDFIISMMGTIGKCMIMPEGIEPGIMDSHLLRLRLNHDKVESKLLIHFFGSNMVLDQIQSLSVGGIMDGLSSSIIKKLKIPLPPTLEEQQAIASALSDVDELIRSLDRLIEKKEAIKKGTMQQLLTGTNRLPGFDGEWEVKSLGELGEAVIGLTYGSEDVQSHGTLVLRSSNIQNSQLAFDDNVYVSSKISSEKYVQEGDVLICARNGSARLIGKCAYISKKDEGAAFGAFMAVLRSEMGKYLYYAFQSDMIQQQINEHLGATINQITNKSLRSFEIPIPLEVNEQKAIAQILSDMDRELQTLRQKREKMRRVKEGMMQELLTGKTRLV